MSKEPGHEKTKRRAKKGERAAERREEREAKPAADLLTWKRKIRKVRTLRFAVSTTPPDPVLPGGFSTTQDSAELRRRERRLRGEAQRLLRKRKKRDERELVKPVGAPPEKKPPEQVFQIIEALDGGAKAITNSAAVKTPDGGVEVIPGRIVRIDGREFHRKHFEIAKKFRKTRTELRIAEIAKKLGLKREEAIEFLRANGWHNLPKKEA